MRQENEKFYSFSFNIPVTKMVPWIKCHRKGSNPSWRVKCRVISFFNATFRILLERKNVNHSHCGKKKFVLISQMPAHIGKNWKIQASW